MLSSRCKWWIVLPVLALLLTACGETESGHIDPNTAEAPMAEETAEEAEKQPEESTPAIEQKSGESTENESLAESAESSGKTSSETVQASEVSEYEKGTTSETGWESEWLNLRFTVPVGATMVSEEELNEMMGLGRELLSEDYETMQIEYGELATVQEMMCKSQDKVTYALVTVEKLPEPMELTDYVAAYESALTNVSGIDYEIISNDEVVSIGAAEYTKLACTTNYYDAQIYQDYYIRIAEDRAVSIVVTYLDKTAAEALLDGFTTF